MSLVTVVNGQLSDASQIMDIVNVLQVPVGGSETGFWFMAGNNNVSGGVLSLWVVFLNHFSTPSGVTINTSIGAPAGGMGSLTVNNVTLSGFQIYANVSTGSNNATAGGGYTANF